MKKLFLTACLAASLGAALRAQPTCEFCGPPDTWDPTFTVSGAMGVGANYHSFVPVGETAVELTIINLEAHENHVMMIAVDAAGERVMRAIETPASGAYVLPPASAANFKRIHFLSLGNFHVTSGTPLNLLGSPTTHFASVSPQRQIKRLELRKLDGSGSITVGVDANGRVFYPAVGNLFGAYDPASRTVTRVDGEVFEVQD